MTNNPIEFVGVEVTDELIPSEDENTICKQEVVQDCLVNSNITRVPISSQVYSYVEVLLDKTLFQPNASNISGVYFDTSVKKEIATIKEYETTSISVENDNTEVSCRRKELSRTECARMVDNFILKCEPEEPIVSSEVGSKLSDSVNRENRLQRKLYRCQRCGKKIADKEEYEEHKKSHLQCQECGKICLSKSNLRDHQLCQHLNIKPHKCIICEKGFVSKSVLKVHHATIHENIKPYECPDCSKRFYSESLLTAHRNTTHVKIKPCKCTECDKSFTRIKFLDRHKMLHHQIV